MMFKDKTLLITGGTGSFGNEIASKFLDLDWREIEYLVVTRKNKTT